MRNWTMAILPLMLATASGCSGADRDRDGGNRSGETRPADSGPAGSKSWSLSGFTGVEAAGPYDVTIRQGDSFAISATGPQAELRSEEHTSELQSLMRTSYAVFCLKKKTQQLTNHTR